MTEASFEGHVLSDFFALLSRSTDKVLLLDYDGTLAPFTVDRDDARPYEGVIERLSVIQRLKGNRLVVISGRTLSDLEHLLGGIDLPELWGGHGWERRTVDGNVILPDIGKNQSEALDELVEIAMQKGLSRRIERKSASVALHLRGLDRNTKKVLSVTLEHTIVPLAVARGLEVRDFDGGSEFSVPGKDKGTAVRTILAEVASETPVAYLGDDLTDENAFEAVTGRGLSVLVRPRPRPTAADIWLRPPEGLIAFLDNWVHSCA